MPPTPSHHVARHDRSGDVLIWSVPFPTFRRGGVWVTGPSQLRGFPSADAMKDDWTIVSGVAAAALVAEAEAALGHALQVRVANDHEATRGT